MASLLMSIIYGIATLSLIPLVQEARPAGQSNSRSRRAIRCSGGAHPG